MMSQNTLKDLLLDLPNAATESEAIIALADLYAAFVEDAEAATPILPAGVQAGRAAMVGGLLGLNTENNGSQALQNGITAFWGAIVISLTSAFVGATTITPPPGISGIKSALDPIFTANVSLSKSKEDSVADIAEVLYLAALGGSVTVGVVTTPIT